MRAVIFLIISNTRTHSFITSLYFSFRLSCYFSAGAFFHSHYTHTQQTHSASVRRLNHTNTNTNTLFERLTHLLPSNVSSFCLNISLSLSHPDHTYSIKRNRWKSIRKRLSDNIEYNLTSGEYLEE